MEEIYRKNIESELKRMSSFLLNEDYVFEHPNFPINKCKLNLSKDIDKDVIDFKLQINSTIFPNDITFKKLGLNITSKIKSKQEFLYIPEKGVTQILAKTFIPTEILKGEISSIYTASFPLKHNSFFRLIFKINEKYGLTNFLGSAYWCGKINYSLGLVILEIDNNTFHVYRHRENEKTYLVIEVLNEISFDNFKISCDSIQKSIAFLNGNYHQDGHFFFSYSSANFEEIGSLYYKNFSNSVISDFELINPQQYRSYMEKPGENLKLTPLLFPENTLSNLVNFVKSKPQLERTIELIIYGNEIRSPLIRCSTYSVALETIVSLVHSENKSVFKPLKKSKKIGKILLELQTVIDNSKSELSEQEFNFLSKKITYLNMPFNKDKYLLAFDFYNIQLPEYLKKLLNTRNLFFHGKTPYEEGELNTRIQELHLEADRIHMLVSILVLKYVGYKGHIKNQAGYRVAMKNIYEDLNIENDESAFYRI
ncbi:MAG: hypothetical protein V4666_02675 [Bacteroidota bacterium]